MSSSGADYSVALLLALVWYGNCAIPDYIHVCHHDDPDLGRCIQNSVETLRPRLKTGIPELEVPSIEPCTLDVISFSTTSESTHLKTNMTDINIYGASDFKILKLVPTLKKNGYTFRFEVILPQLHLEGQYEIDSRVLLLQLQGKGPFSANASNYHFECIMKGHKIVKEGKNYLNFEKMKCNAEVGNVSISLQNLFNGNPILGKATNDVINDNSDAFFEEIKPSLVNAISEKFTDIANKITLNFSYEELFP